LKLGIAVRAFLDVQGTTRSTSGRMPVPYILDAWGPPGLVVIVRKLESELVVLDNSRGINIRGKRDSESLHLLVVGCSGVVVSAIADGHRIVALRAVPQRAVRAVEATVADTGLDLVTVPVGVGVQLVTGGSAKLLNKAALPVARAIVRADGALAGTASVPLEAHAFTSLAVTQALGRAFGVVVSIVPVVRGPSNIECASALGAVWSLPVGPACALVRAEAPTVARAAIRAASQSTSDAQSGDSNEEGSLHDRRKRG